MAGFSSETLTRLALLLFTTSSSVFGHGQHQQQQQQPSFLPPGQYKEFNYPVTSNSKYY
jgi:hypothetical protein